MKESNRTYDEYTITANYDFCDFEKGHDSIPTEFSINGLKFKSIDEAVMYIAIAFDENARITIDLAPREEKLFIASMRKLCIQEKKSA